MDEKELQNSEDKREPNPDPGAEQDPGEEFTDQDAVSLKDVSTEIKSTGSEAAGDGETHESIHKPQITDAPKEKKPEIDIASQKSEYGPEIDAETEEDALINNLEAGSDQSQAADPAEEDASPDDEDAKNSAEKLRDVDAAADPAGIETDSKTVDDIGTVEEENEGRAEGGGDQEPVRSDLSKSEKERSGDYAEQEKLEKSAPKRSWTKIAFSAVLVLAVFSGFFLFDNKSATRGIQKENSKAPENEATHVKKQSKTIRNTQPAVANSQYHVKINEIKALREVLLRKLDEIAKLKMQYQQDIEELENEVLDELQKEQVGNFIKAFENKRIEYTLRTIQRKQMYIQQLDRPYNWVLEAGEELLFIRRRTMMDLQVAEVASGIDMQKNMRHMNDAILKYQPTADKLALVTTDARPEPLLSIWERIQDKQHQHSSGWSRSKNRIISEQICSGNFNRLAELSEISADTARCIIEMESADLFLNGLSEISPAAARYLFQWNGSWICLNGLRALSPRVANYLFQWEGDWISLNGLSEFPTEIGDLLLQWDGDQLELMGLKSGQDPSGKWITYLARWERTGGRLFVPDDVRMKIDKLKREMSGT